MRNPMTWIVTVLIVTIGCQRHESQKSERSRLEQQSAQSQTQETETEGFVIVIGDHTASEVLRHLDENSIRVWTDLTDQAYAKLIIVAQDAQQGLTIHDKVLSELKPNDVKHLLWLMTNCDLIEDQELLELEELEARELLIQHGFRGDAIQFAFDAGTVPAESFDDSPRGWAAIKQYIVDLK